MPEWIRGPGEYEACPALILTNIDMIDTRPPRPALGDVGQVLAAVGLFTEDDTVVVISYWCVNGSWGLQRAMRMVSTSWPRTLAQAGADATRTFTTTLVRVYALGDWSSQPNRCPAYEMIISIMGRAICDLSTARLSLSLW